MRNDILGQMIEIQMKLAAAVAESLLEVLKLRTMGSLLESGQKGVMHSFAILRCHRLNETEDSF